VPRRIKIFGFSDFGMKKCLKIPLTLFTKRGNIAIPPLKKG
jgi:hypothetical protein